MPKTKIVEDQSFERAPTHKYTTVSQHTRCKLCMLVIDKKQKVNSAAKSLKLNISTAKLIVKTFKFLPQNQQQIILAKGRIPKCQKSKEQERSFKNRIRRRPGKQINETKKVQNNLIQEEKDEEQLEKRRKQKINREVQAKSEPRDTYMIEKSYDSDERREELQIIQPYCYVFPMLYVMPCCMEINKQIK